ncbi:MAG: divalent-cation tolerance protein CutA [Proteobacteria bacterium]|nr:divalent-cation tolerance protein CutA [Pseudomonadota bacterium]
MKTSFSLFYVTFPDMQSAEAFSRLCLAEKVAACVNMFPGMKSVYWWKGEVQTNSEIVTLIKAPSHHKSLLEKLLKEKHPYEVPCLLEIPTASIGAAYEKWLLESLN